MVGAIRIKSPYAPLTTGEVRGVHRAALEVLETVGMAAPVDRAWQVGLAHGCWLDDGGRLRFPPSLVEDCLSRAATSFPICGRDRHHDFETGPDRVSFATGGAAVMMLDRETRKYRASTVADLYDPAMTRLAVDSIDTYLAAEATTGQSVGFRQTGSLRLATSPAERFACEAMIPAYEELGIPYSVVTAAEAACEHPLINTKGVVGAAPTPTGGHVDSGATTRVLAKAARLSGGVISTGDPVTKLEPVPAGWRITSAKGEIVAEHIVLAASFWTRELAATINLQLPLHAIQHHEIITGDVVEMAGQTGELPVIRDPWSSANIRLTTWPMRSSIFRA